MEFLDQLLEGQGNAKLPNTICGKNTDLTAQLHSFSGFFIFGFFGFGFAPPDPPPKRSFATFDQGGQTGPPRANDFSFGAADDTRAADDRPAGRLTEHQTERPAEAPEH